jgi:hypothetical protein
MEDKKWRREKFRRGEAGAMSWFCTKGWWEVAILGWGSASGGDE